jgi:hypothetical protein
LLKQTCLPGEQARPLSVAVSWRGVDPPLQLVRMVLAGVRIARRSLSCTSSPLCLMGLPLTAAIILIIAPGHVTWALSLIE